MLVLFIPLFGARPALPEEPRITEGARLLAFALLFWGLCAATDILAFLGWLRDPRHGARLRVFAFLFTGR